MKKTPIKTKKQQPRTHAQKIAHHAKRVVVITPKFVHGMFAGAFVGALVVGVVSMVNPSSALSISSTRDCSANAVLKCGVLTTEEVKQKYNAGNPGAAGIYAAYGISSADIGSIDRTAVAGRVMKNGTVMVGDKVVATDAASAGRQYIKGSQKVTKNGVTFYNSPASTSFRSSSINAYVVMKDGQFAFAILGACGNPVVARAIPKPTPPAPTKPTTPTTPTTPTPPVVTPPVTPTPTPETPPADTPIPLPAPTPEPVVVQATAAQPAELPKTGPGAVIAIATLSIIGGYIFHITHRHTQNKRHNKRSGHHA